MSVIERTKKGIEKIRKDIRQDKANLRSKVYFKKLNDHYLPILKTTKEEIEQESKSKQDDRDKKINELKSKLGLKMDSKIQSDGSKAPALGIRTLTPDNIQRWNYLSKALLSRLRTEAQYGNFPALLEQYAASEDKDFQIALFDSFSDVLKIKEDYINLSDQRIKQDEAKHGIKNSAGMKGIEKNEINQNIAKSFDKLAERFKSEDQKKYEEALNSDDGFNSFHYSMAKDLVDGLINELQQEQAFDNPDAFNESNDMYFEGKNLGTPNQAIGL